MLFPRPRFTIRSLMVAVAILASAWGGIIEAGRRRVRFEAIAHAHWIESIRLEIAAPIEGEADATEEAGRMARLAWRDRMTSKYDRAARRPWLPVAPDPPMPE